MSDAKKDKPSADQTDANDVREQMRLALERKQNSAHGGPSHADGSSKASHATENAKVSREFRRKSGG